MRHTLLPRPNARMTNVDVGTWVAVSAALIAAASAVVAVWQARAAGSQARSAVRQATAAEQQLALARQQLAEVRHDRASSADADAREAVRGFIAATKSWLVQIDSYFDYYVSTAMLLPGRLRAMMDAFVLVESASMAARARVNDTLLGCLDEIHSISRQLSAAAASKRSRLIWVYSRPARARNIQSERGLMRQVEQLLEELDRNLQVLDGAGKHIAK